MATIISHPLVPTIYGSLDSFVLRRHRGKSLLQRRPRFTQPRTERQLHTQSRFGGGSAYAAQVKDDPALRDRYCRAGKSDQLNYRQMAIRDFFNPPTIDGFSADGYSPATGGEFTVRARDDFEVAGVRIRLCGADDQLIVEGEAHLHEAAWQFMVPPETAAAGLVQTVEVFARDRPGNVTRRVFSL